MSDGTNPYAGALTNLTAPPWMEGDGDNAWQMTAATFVALQTIPGLCVLYAGLVKKKWVINSMFMVFYGFAMTLMCWVIWGYKVGFGEYMLPFAGHPGPVLTIDYEIMEADLYSANIVPYMPMATMIYFQFVFAAITIALIAGAYLARMNIVAWMLFVPLWITFSYCIGAYSIWGGGFLFQMGVLDYSGGYVIHLSSGTAAFVGSWWIGPRLQYDRQNFQPSNYGLAMVGAGILWVGWNGFNGGDPYAANPDAGVAVLNTNICTGASLLVWTAMDMIFYKKPSLLGAINGMITGLVAITPAAGFIDGWAALVFGLVSGSLPWVSMNVLGKTKLFTKHVDDVLGITHTHMVTGAIGGFMTGLFATTEGVAGFALTSGGGAIERNGTQVWLQIVGALFIIGWNLVWTSLILCFIKYVLRVPLRMSEEALLLGDAGIHGEDAYCFIDDAVGLVPTVTQESRAMDLIRQMDAREHHTILEGQDPEMALGISHHNTKPIKEGSSSDGNGVKTD